MGIRSTSSHFQQMTSKEAETVKNFCRKIYFVPFLVLDSFLLQLVEIFISEAIKFPFSFVCGCWWLNTSIIWWVESF